MSKGERHFACCVRQLYNTQSVPCAVRLISPGGCLVNMAVQQEFRKDAHYEILLGNNW
jgi:hypothetical protein